MGCDISHPYRKVGVALIALGIFDVVFIVGYIINNSYYYNLNIPVIVGGVYLLRKNAKVAKIIRFVSVILMAWYCGGGVVLLIRLLVYGLWSVKYIH